MFQIYFINSANNFYVTETSNISETHLICFRQMIEHYITLKFINTKDICNISATITEKFKNIFVMLVLTSQKSSKYPQYW